MKCGFTIGISPNAKDSNSRGGKSEGLPDFLSQSLVTGHQGFIGHYLVSYLLKNNQRLLLFDGNAESISDLKRVFNAQGFYKIFHLSGRVPKYNRVISFGRRDYESNLRSVSNVAR